MTAHIIFDEPEIGDVAVLTGEILPELEGPTVYILAEIDHTKPKPYRFWEVIQPHNTYSAPRDVLTGVAVVRGTTRGVYR